MWAKLQNRPPKLVPYKASLHSAGPLQFQRSDLLLTWLAEMLEQLLDKNWPTLAEKYCTLYIVPDKWRASLLVELLEQKSEMSVMKEKTDTISEVIDSLCCS